MAIYRRSYKPYTGSLTPVWSRFLVLFHYSRKTLFRSKLQTGLFVVCFFFPLLCLGSIYLAHNAGFLAQMGVPPEILTIDNRFFFHFLAFVFAYLRSSRDRAGVPLTHEGHEVGVELIHVGEHEAVRRARIDEEP